MSQKLKQSNLVSPPRQAWITSSHELGKEWEQLPPSEMRNMRLHLHGERDDGKIWIGHGLVSCCAGELPYQGG